MRPRYFAAVLSSAWLVGFGFPALAPPPAVARPAAPGGAVEATRHEGPVTLDLDASDVGRKILHAKLKLPVAPGALTLLYPKWIPGEHGPTGPITDLAGLKFSA